MIKKMYRKYKNSPLVAKAAIWFVVCSVLQKCISFITVPIFTRLMSQSEYGLYSIFLSWYNIIVVICTLNMHTCVYSNGLVKAKNETEKNNLAIPMLSLSEIITIIIFLIYILFYKQINGLTGLTFPLTCLIFIQGLFEAPINFWLTKQRFEYKYIKLVIITILMVTINSTLGVLFVIISNNNQALARVFSIVLVQFIFGLIFYIYFFKKAKAVFSTKNWKRVLKVQLPLLPHSLSLNILASSDRIMINKLVNSMSAGIYSVSYSAGYIIGVLKNSIIDAIRPNVYEKLKTKNYCDIKKITNPLIIFIVLLTLIFMGFAPEIITIMAPRNYLEAIYIIPPVAVSSFFTFVYNMFSFVSFYYERTKSIMVASTTSALLNIILNFIFIKKFGYIAAGYTTLVCYIYLSISHYIIMKRTCKKERIEYNLFDLKFIIAISILMIFAIFVFTYFYTNNIIRYIFIVVMILILIIKKKSFIELFKRRG